jgi:hypothetical protein
MMLLMRFSMKRVRRMRVMGPLRTVGMRRTHR